MSLLKRVIWWDFERASWQWDVLCLLIMAFIFLTPRSWFGAQDKPATQTPAAVVKPQAPPQR